MRNALICLAALCLFAVAPLASADQWSKSWTVSSGAELRLVTDRGNIHVTQIPGNSIHANITTDYWYISESEVEITASQDGNTVEIHVRVPEEHFHFFHHDARVDIELEVPAGSKLGLRTGFGKVRVSRFDGRVDAETGFGDMDADGRFESLSLRTGFGAIRAEASPGSRITSDWRLSSGFGHVTLRLPQNLNADIDARSGFGHVSCDLPITIAETNSHSSLRGRIGSGGPQLYIDTGFGSVRLEKI